MLGQSTPIIFVLHAILEDLTGQTSLLLMRRADLECYTCGIDLRLPCVRIHRFVTLDSQSDELNEKRICNIWNNRVV